MLAITPTKIKSTVGFPHQSIMKCTVIGDQKRLRTNPSSKLVKRPMMKPKIPAEIIFFSIDPNKEAAINTPTTKLNSLYPVEKTPASYNCTVPNVSQNRISPMAKDMTNPATLPIISFFKSKLSNSFI